MAISFNKLEDKLTETGFNIRYHNLDNEATKEKTHKKGYQLSSVNYMEPYNQQYIKIHTNIKNPHGFCNIHSLYLIKPPTIGQYPPFIQNQLKFT